MTTPRFPARGTPEYWDFLEHWLMVERVDNDRQWRLLRRAAAQLSGLNPVQVLVNLNFANGSGSGRGSGSGSGSGSGTFNCPDHFTNVSPAFPFGSALEEEFTKPARNKA